MIARLRFLALAALLGTAHLAAAAANSVSIARHDGLIWADVNSAGRTLHFVVDTGAASSCIDLRAARELSLKMGSPLLVAGVAGQASGCECGGFQATVAGLALPSRVVAMDFSAPSRACSQRIDGLIGADFFRGTVVKIDYARGLMTRGNSTGPASGIPLKFQNGVMLAPVALDGATPRWTRVDTGCTEPLIWCGATANNGKTRSWTVALASPNGDATHTNISVGAFYITDVPVKFRNREIFPGEAGLLGNATLSRYTVTIDGIHGRLSLSRD